MPGPTQNTTESEPFIYKAPFWTKVALRLAKKPFSPSLLIATEPKPPKKRAAEAGAVKDLVGEEGLVSEPPVEKTRAARIVHLPKRFRE